MSSVQVGLFFFGCLGFACVFVMSDNTLFILLPKIGARFFVLKCLKNHAIGGPNYAKIVSKNLVKFFGFFLQVKTLWHLVDLLY